MKRAGASLAELSGQPLTRPSEFRSGLIDQWEAAWIKPVNQLTCEEVLCLFSQGSGLPWLADPIAEFVESYPDAETAFYPGDMTIEALRQFDRLKEADARAARRIELLDLTGLIESAFSFSRPLRREAESLYEAIKSQCA